MKDYYKTLGVEKSASKDDIKKAFRKLAHEHHPDKNKNDPSSAQKFKEASEAYSILSDDKKRQQYDTFGQAGAGFNPGAGGFNPNDFGGFDFSQFTQGGQGGVEFDLGDIFGDIFAGGRRAREERGRDVSVDIRISFEESIFGVDRDIRLTKTSSCLSCDGTGAVKGSGQKTCDKCGGKGKFNETRRSFIGVFNTTRVCDACHGRGQIPKEKCHVCHGRGVLEREQEITVKIPSGIESGQMVRLHGMGEAITNGAPGDLYVKVHVQPHASIRKDGYNLVTDLKIKLSTALLGEEHNLKTLDGDIVLKIPEGTNTGDVLRVKGRGVPNERGRRGDLLVQIMVDIPKKLSREARKAIDGLRAEGI